MVVLPSEFVETKFPGYFWNVVDKRLYSVKVHGVLRPLKKQKQKWFFVNGSNRVWPDGYWVSVNGRRRFMAESDLMPLEQKNAIQHFPVENQT